MKKEVYLLAYSHKNFGDDLFLQLICNRFPDVVFYLKSFSENCAFSKIENLRILKENRFQKILKKIIPFYIPFSSLIRNVSIVILIGGSMFMQGRNWERKLDHQKRIRRLSSKYCLLGSNFGPYTDDQYVSAYRDFFYSLDDCCFRDKRSFNLFANDEKVRYAFDIAFSVPYKKKVEKSNCVVISVIDVSRKKELIAYQSQYLNAISGIVQNFCEDGKDVILLSMCEEQGDLDVCKEIKNKFYSYDNMSIVNYDGDTQCILDLFAKAEFVVATRFHAMIMGFRFGCKVFPIAYNEKLTNVLNDLNVDFNNFILKNVNKINLSSFISVKDNEILMESSLQQFAYLDGLFR